MMSEELKLKMKEVLGDLRGDWMALRRRELFKERHGREPDFAARLHPVSLIAEDFILATALLDKQVEYDAFAQVVFATACKGL